jgi:predicted nucleotidyltransferase component of viral defense system
MSLRLKVEINTREHFCVHGLTLVPFTVASRWFEGSSQIQSYDLDELLATKLRALYQRKQGRDLFDLAIALQDPRVDPPRVVTAFSEYMTREGHAVTRAQFEENLVRKMRDPQFMADISPLLAPGHEWDAKAAARLVSSRLIARLPGAGWKGETNVNPISRGRAAP